MTIINENYKEIVKIREEEATKHRDGVLHAVVNDFQKPRG